MTTLDFSKSLAQRRAYHRFQPNTTVGLGWGRGLGKSFFLRQQWFIQADKWEFRRRPGAPHPGVRQVLLMPTLEQARKVHFDLMQLELEGMWKAFGARFNQQTFRLVFPGGSWVQWVSAERAHLLRGIRADIVYGDECDDLDPDTISSVVDPWFSEPHSLKMQLYTGTPRRGRYGLLYKAVKEWPREAYWTAQGFEPEQAARFAGQHFGIHATAYDAPALVDPEYVDKIRGKTQPTIFRREWLCDFDAADGLVYGMFDEDFHVRPAPPRPVWNEIVVCADHGFTDAGCILILGIQGHGRDAVVWVLHEIYETERPTSWWRDKAKQIVGWYPQAKWYADPSRADVIADWKRLGARFPEVVGLNAIEAGIMAVADRLWIREAETMETQIDADGAGMRVFDAGKEAKKTSRLYVTPQCVNTIREFGTYRRKRDPRNPEAVLETVEDRNNHAMDTLRYGVFGRFGPTEGGGRNAGRTQLGRAP